MKEIQIDIKSQTEQLSSHVLLRENMAAHCPSKDIVKCLQNIAHTFVKLGNPVLPGYRPWSPLLTVAPCEGDKGGPPVPLGHTAKEMAPLGNYEEYPS